MATPASPYLARGFVIGVLCLAGVTFGYLPVVDYFYYGGGWPFIQIIFLGIYVVGVRRVRGSDVPRWFRWCLYVAPALWWLIAMQWEELMVS